MLIYAKIMGKINALIKIIFECFCGHLKKHIPYIETFDVGLRQQRENETTTINPN